MTKEELKQILPKHKINNKEIIDKSLEIIIDAFPEEIVEKILKKKISNKKITELKTKKEVKPFVDLLMLLRRKNATDEMYDKLAMLYEKYRV